MEIKDVENLAALARIELTEPEKQELLSDMDSILEYVKQIEKTKVKDVDERYDVYNVWRGDKTDSREFSRELIIGQFPHSQEGFLKVKKIL